MSDALEQAVVLLQQAITWQQDGDVKRAEQTYRRVLVMDPANADAMNLLGVIHHERGDRDLAIRMIRAALKIKNSPLYWNNLAVVLGARGDRTGCIAALRQAVQLNPTNIDHHGALIFAMDLHTHSAPAVRLADRRFFDARCCAALTAKAAPHENGPDPERRLRVGYVSGDFKEHSASLVFANVLKGQTGAVETFAYSNLAVKEHDDVTEMLGAYFEHWHDVADLSDAALADLIRYDKIDILVDLSGFSGGNRLLAFARKPAPVQMTGWGHVTGTGLDAMDYILADELAIPPEHEHLYHEQILRLPCTVSYAPREPYPDVAPPPRETHGYTTFGYLGRANKTSEAVWAAWAEILQRVPHSRLILKANDYQDDGYRSAIADFFVSLRIGTSRFDFLGASDSYTHKQFYNEIDIALDPFPQGGGVTTLEASLMGVPSVVMLGNYLNGRIAPSILRHVDGAEDFPETAADYVETAVSLAEQPQTLGMRLARRRRLLSSILCDPSRYATDVEDAYREAWRSWCESRRPAIHELIGSH